MDPVSVFNALYDTKCLSFTTNDTKDSPYQIDLARLSLYPKLMNSIVELVTEKYLTTRSLQAHSARKSPVKSKDPKEEEGVKTLSASEESDADSHFDEELETSSGAEEMNDWEKVDDLGESIILSASERSSVPLAAAIAFKAHLPHLSNDLELLETTAANDDTKNQEPARRQVILIEDVITSGKETLETIRKTEKSQKLKVQFVISIVDCDKHGIERLEREGIRVMSLYNMGAILRILEITGRITMDQYSLSRQWIAKNELHSM